jgi:hypothetical protein
MGPMRSGALVVLATLLAVTGCMYQSTTSDFEPPASRPASDATLTIADASGAPDGPVQSIADAIANAGDAPGHVQGALLIDADGTVRLCEALAESFPPQCGGRRLVVDGLDLDSLGALQDENGARWLDSATLFGTISAP